MVYLRYSQPAFPEGLRKRNPIHPDTPYDIIGSGMVFFIPQSLQIKRLKPFGPFVLSLRTTTGSAAISYEYSNENFEIAALTSFVRNDNQNHDPYDT